MAPSEYLSCAACSSGRARQLDQLPLPFETIHFVHQRLHHNALARVVGLQLDLKRPLEARPDPCIAAVVLHLCLECDKFVGRPAPLSK